MTCDLPCRRQSHKLTFSLRPNNSTLLINLVTKNTPDGTRQRAGARGGRRADGAGGAAPVNQSGISTTRGKPISNCLTSRRRRRDNRRRHVNPAITRLYIVALRFGAPTSHRSRLDLYVLSFSDYVSDPRT
ncbi:hypothetical protein EVAR_17482_1 [Eumeta japonica]|uniref:Uncharacterized protein n=1 Tax=Eumeta variegata TaxID=151549 RepID=A0A4C1ZL53_EUMVA|nr:hypothetical protein EVAR_17482_1 [Eumeta japonica]